LERIISLNIDILLIML